MGAGRGIAVLVAVGCAGAVARAQPAFVDQGCYSLGPGPGSPSVSLTAAWSLTPGNLLVVGAGHLDAGGKITLSDSLGNAFQDVAGGVAPPDSGFSGATGQVFYAVVADGGSDVFSITFPTQEPQGEIFVQEYSGLPSPVVVAVSVSHSASFPFKATLTDAGAATLVVAYAIGNNEVGLAPDAFTLRNTCNSDVSADAIGLAMDTWQADFTGPTGPGPVVAILAGFASATAVGDAGLDGGLDAGADAGAHSGLEGALGCGCGSAPPFGACALLLGGWAIAARRRRQFVRSPPRLRGRA